MTEKKGDDEYMPNNSADSADEESLEQTLSIDEESSLEEKERSKKKRKIDKSSSLSTGSEKVSKKKENSVSEKGGKKTKKIIIVKDKNKNNDNKKKVAKESKNKVSSTKNDESEVEMKPRKSIRIETTQQEADEKKKKILKLKDEKKKKKEKKDGNFSNAKSDRNLIRLEGQLERVEKIYEIKFDQSNNRSLAENFEDSQYAIDVEDIENTSDEESGGMNNNATTTTDKKRKRKTKADLLLEQKRNKAVALVRYQVDNYNHCISQIQSDMDMKELELVVGDYLDTVVMNNTDAHNTTSGYTNLKKIKDIAKKFSAMKRDSRSKVYQQSLYRIVFDLCQNYLKMIKTGESLDVNHKNNDDGENVNTEFLNFDQENDYYINRQKIVHTISGFFDEELRFGEYYIFMCKLNNFGGKKQFTVVHRVVERDSVCELNFDLIDKLYSAFLTRESIMLQKNCDLAEFQNNVKQKYSVSRLAALKRAQSELSTKKDYTLMYFNLLDGDLQIWKYKWFEILFNDCEYLKDKFLLEIEDLYPREVLNTLKLCSAESLFKLLVMLGKKSIHLCFFSKLPKEIRSFMIGTDQQNEMELSIENYCRVAHLNLQEIDVDHESFQKLLIAYYYKVHFSYHHSNQIEHLEKMLDINSEMGSSSMYSGLERKKIIAFDSNCSEYRLKSDMLIEKSIGNFLTFIFTKGKNYFKQETIVEESLNDFAYKLYEEKSVKQEECLSTKSQHRIKVVGSSKSLISSTHSSNISNGVDNENDDDGGNPENVKVGSLSVESMEVDDDEIENDVNNENAYDLLDEKNKILYKIGKSFLKNPLTIVVSSSSRTAATTSLRLPDTKNVASYLQEIICDIENEYQKCLVVGSSLQSNSGNYTALTSKTRDQDVKSEQSITRHIGVYSIENTIFRLLQTKNSLIKVCQKAQNIINSEDITPCLSETEVERLCDTPVYSYFKEKGKLHVLAQILTMSFFKKLDSKMVAEMCIYCNLVQKTILIIDNAESVTSEMFETLIDCLPNIRKIAIVGTEYTKKTNYGSQSLSFESNKSILLTEFQNLFQSKSFYFDFNNYPTIDDRQACQPLIDGPKDLQQTGNAENLHHKLYDLFIERRSLDNIENGRNYKELANNQSQNLFLFRINMAKTEIKTVLSKILDSLCGTRKSNFENKILFGNYNRELDAICYFCPTNYLRNIVAQQCFTALLEKEKSIVQTLAQWNEEKLAKCKKLWSKGGVFKTVQEYRKVYEKRVQFGYKEEQFFLGDNIVITASHPGQRKILFCPFQSDSLQKDFVDRIDLIFDYNTFTNGLEFPVTTNEPVKNPKYTKRFIVLKKSGKTILFNNYFKHYLRYSFARNYNSQGSPESLANGLLVGKKYRSFLNNTQVFTMLKNTKSKAFILIQNTDSDPCSVEDSLIFGSTNKDLQAHQSNIDKPGTQSNLWHPRRALQSDPGREASLGKEEKSKTNRFTSQNLVGLQALVKNGSKKK